VKREGDSNGDLLRDAPAARGGRRTGSSYAGGTGTMELLGHWRREGHQKGRADVLWRAKNSGSCWSALYAWNSCSHQSTW